MNVKKLALKSTKSHHFQKSSHGVQEPHTSHVHFSIQELRLSWHQLSQSWEAAGRVVVLSQHCEQPEQPLKVHFSSQLVLLVGHQFAHPNASQSLTDGCSVSSVIVVSGRTGIESEHSEHDLHPFQEQTSAQLFFCAHHCGQFAGGTTVEEVGEGVGEGVGGGVRGRSIESSTEEHPSQPLHPFHAHFSDHESRLEAHQSLHISATGSGACVVGITSGSGSSAHSAHTLQPCQLHACSQSFTLAHHCGHWESMISTSSSSGIGVGEGDGSGVGEGDGQSVIRGTAASVV